MDDITRALSVLHWIKTYNVNSVAYVGPVWARLLTNLTQKRIPTRDLDTNGILQHVYS